MSKISSKGKSVTMSRYMKTDVRLRVHKGRKQAIQTAAGKASLNGYITQAVDERMERGGWPTEPPAPEEDATNA